MAESKSTTTTMSKNRRGGLLQHRNSIRAAVVGFPNTGKSGLFNVLTGNRNPVDDAAFTTVREANGVAVHEDPRFMWLCGHFSPGLAVPGRVRVVDLPGIVPGSFQGAGVGCDVFKKHAAASDVLLLVVRAFDGQQVTQCVGDTVNPLRELDQLLAELVAIDRATVVRLWGELVAFVERKQGGTQTAAEFKSLDKIQNYLKKTKKPVRFGVDWDDQDLAVIRKHKLLTAKELVYVVNLSARDYLKPPQVHASHTSLLGRVRDFLGKEGHEDTDGQGQSSVLCAYSGEFEARLQALRCKAPAGGGDLVGAVRGSGGSRSYETPTPAPHAAAAAAPGQGGAHLLGPLPPPSLAADVALVAAGGVVGGAGFFDTGEEGGGAEVVGLYLAANPTHHSARTNVLSCVFNALGLVHFFTVGPEEVRAWALPRGWRAPQAAGVIHRDFETDFMSVEVETFLDLQDLGSEVAVKRDGKLTLQGLKYVIQDGDICFFRFKLPNYKAFRG